MSSSAQTRLFYDSVDDALRTVIQALGGNKAVGSKLWPEKSADAAGRLLADCLNDNKAERLAPDQLLLILRWGHEVGCHAGMAYIAQEAGYSITPISHEEERDKLADAILEASRTLARAMKAAENLPQVRRVA